MSRIPTAEELIERWGLEQMSTENVLFSQTYVAPDNGHDGKPLCTAIVALLTDDPNSFSDMHRLPTDEIWHFYLGDPIELLLLYPNGHDELVILGQDILEGQRIQVVVTKDVWMGARLQPGGMYGVYGNTMAPGYVLSDFEGGVAEDLATRWPHRADLIKALTRPSAPIRYG
ncbi:MAG: cupin domain-containing protein [Pseudomonadales bacterium]